MRTCLLSIVMIGLLGCGQQEADEVGTTSIVNPLQDSEKRLSFSWYIDYPWFVPPNPWGQDPVSAWLKEHKAVAIDWLSPSVKGSGDFDTFVATGNFPDILCINRGSKVTQLLEMDALLALDPYLDLLPNLKKWLGPLNMALLRSDDGKLYQFPNWYIDPDMKVGNGTAGWAVNKKIHRALGSPALVNFDDLRRYLSAVKKSYPHVLPLEVSEDNQALSLYIRASAPQQVEHFGRMLGSPKSDVFGKVFDDPLVVDAFIYFARLNRENLVSAEAFIQSRDQVLQKMINQSVAVIASMDVLSVLHSAEAVDDQTHYQIIWPPVKNGVDPRLVALSTSQSVGWNVNVFPKSAEPKIKELLTYLDWLTGEEGQRILSYGPPGYFWSKVDQEGIPIWNEVYRECNLAQRDAARLFRWNWVGNTTWVDNGKVKANQRLPLDKQDKWVKSQSEILWKTTMFSDGLSYSFPSPESELGIKISQMRDVFDDTRRLATMAKNEAEVRSLLKEAQSKLDSLGYQEYLDFAQAQLKKRRDLLKRNQEIGNTGV